MSAKLKILISMIIWGSLGIFIRFISLPSLEIAFLRAIIASVSIFLIKTVFIKEKINLVDNRNILFISGIFLAFNWIFLFEAYKKTTIANATLSYYMAPVLAVVFASFLIKEEKLSFRGMISLLVSFSGLIIIYQMNSTASFSKDQTSGIFFGLLAAFMYAFVVICNKKMKNISPFDRVLVQMAISSLIMMPIVIYRRQLAINSTNELFILLIVGLVHTTFAYLLYFPSIEHVKVQTASILSYIDPVSALIFGSLFLSEPLSIAHIIGGFLVLLGSYISSRNKI
ncbi:MAG: DMT family transporter [Clostridia bacterium]